MSDFVVVGGPPSVRFAETGGRPLELLCPWAALLPPNDGREFYAEIGALFQKWHERALEVQERSLGDLAAI